MLENQHQAEYAEMVRELARLLEDASTDERFLRDKMFEYELKHLTVQMRLREEHMLQHDSLEQQIKDRSSQAQRAVRVSSVLLAALAAAMLGVISEFLAERLGVSGLVLIILFFGIAGLFTVIQSGFSFAGRKWSRGELFNRMGR